MVNHRKRIRFSLTVGIALSCFFAMGARADGSASGTAGVPAAHPCRPSVESVLPYVVDDQGHLHQNFRLPLQIVENDLPGPRAPIPRVVPNPPASAPLPDTSTVRAGELGFGDNKTYVIDIKPHGQPQITLRGRKVSDGVYAGVIRVGDILTLSGSLDTSQGVQVSHDADFRVVSVKVDDGLTVIGMVRQSVRAAESPGKAGFVVGAGGVAGLLVKSGRDRVVKLTFSGEPGVSDAGKVSASPILGAQVSFDY